METGVSIVYFLNGEDAGTVNLYTQLGGNVGLGGGVSGEFFISTFNENADGSFFNATEFGGAYNSYSGSFMGFGGSYSWSNEQNKHDEVYPGHRHTTTWTSRSAGGSWSPKRLGKAGGKFSGGTSTYHGALELKSQERK